MLTPENAAQVLHWLASVDIKGAEAAKMVVIQAELMQIIKDAQAQEAKGP